MSIDLTTMQSIGWALIHSIWQSAILFMLYMILSKVSSRSAVGYRYALSTIMLILVLICFGATVALIAETGRQASVDSSQLAAPTSFAVLETARTSVSGIFENLNSWFNANLLWVIRIWLIGSVIGMLRVLSGVAYLYFLRKSALPIAGVWEEEIHGLAVGMKILRQVELAEARVSAPIVIGFLKPVILFPIGLMARLSTAQVEAIIVHELAHIRRHDFIVNVFQCLMESVFFFNPFVWLLSARMRVLREECCDDVVLRHGIAPLMYVKTLANVEELSTERFLAPAFTGQRNQLLNRMKRIMEKSVVKKEWGMIKLLPLWLALIGLVCASWLSIGTDEAKHQDLDSFISPEANAPVDTLVDKYEDESTASFYYRRDSDSEDTWLPPTEPEDDTQEFRFAPFQTFEEFDSIPAFHFPPGNDWETFEKEFTKKFRQEFGEFFNKNREQYEKMMEELRRQHAEDKSFMFHQFDAGHLKAWDDFALVNPWVPNHPNHENFKIPEFNEEWIQENLRFEVEAKAMSEMLRGQEGLMRVQEDLFLLQEKAWLDNELNFHEYEKAIVEQLIEDGYLKKDEKLGDLHISNDEITVNGKKIKEKDLDKYQEIRKKYAPRWAKPHRPE